MDKIKVGEFYRWQRNEITATFIVLKYDHIGVTVKVVDANHEMLKKMKHELYSRNSVFIEESEPVTVTSAMRVLYGT